ncbi:hypothetical protein [Croceicoccus estronivorus]|uniref:hypothetical protein n=1 Tax=Croceicoccus estronivorus TaxID=1172626 RepID=UPI0012E8E534|nr:hypothetical protein [Croceicoccus estronivorus]
MNTALKQPVWFGLDQAQTASRPTCTFICSDCDRMHNGITDRIPDGWDLQPGAYGNAPRLRCPDCIEQAEQAEIARRQAQPFMLFLEKQATGQFHIAMAPENVLMRWLPLGFYLTPAQARALAAQLTQYATLAEVPGSVLDGDGGVA